MANQGSRAQTCILDSDRNPQTQNRPTPSYTRVWPGKAKYTSANSMIARAERCSAFAATINATSSLIVTHPKFAAIVRSRMRQSNASTRKWRDSHHNAQCAKVPTLRGSNVCPIRKKEMEQVERAKQARSIYWHVSPREGSIR